MIDRRQFLTGTAASAAATMLAKRASARNHLVEYTKFLKPTYKPGAVHYTIASVLHDVMAGKRDRVMIFTPPRHGKSELVSRKFPGFYMGHHPEKQLMCTSYGSDLANMFGRDVIKSMGSPEYKALFPKVSLSDGSAGRFFTEDGGVYLSTGVGGAVTGMGAHLLLIDDPVKSRAEAESDVVRASTWDWYRSTAYTRLMPGGAVILIMTRWHEDDLAGMLLLEEENGGDQWDKIILPAINEHGEALWPEAFPVEALMRIKNVTLAYDWEALYMQRPRKPGGNYFEELDMLVEGQPVPFPAHCDGVYAIVDSAAKTGKDNDATAVTFYARSRFGGHPLTILDWDVTQIEGASLEVWLPWVFTELETLAAQTGAREGSLGVWIEDKSTGTVLLQQAGAKMLPVQAIDSGMTALGKIERGINTSPYVRRGDVKFSDRAYNRVKNYKGRTRNHLLAQVLNFRIGTKDMIDDDLFDTFCYGVCLGVGGSGGF